MTQSASQSSVVRTIKSVTEVIAVQVERTNVLHRPPPQTDRPRPVERAMNLFPGQLRLAFGDPAREREREVGRPRNANACGARGA